MGLCTGYRMELSLSHSLMQLFRRKLTHAQDSPASMMLHSEGGRHRSALPVNKACYQSYTIEYLALSGYPDQENIRFSNSRKFLYTMYMNIYIFQSFLKTRIWMVETFLLCDCGSTCSSRGSKSSTTWMVEVCTSTSKALPK